MHVRYKRVWFVPGSGYTKTLILFASPIITQHYGVRLTCSGGATCLPAN